MFFDRARIHVSGGDGGDGIVAFRREKHQPRGGPAGGNGGRGGHVWMTVNSSLNTLMHLRRHIHHRAGRGARGGGTGKRGAYGPDHHIEVPAGTLVRDADTGALLADLTAGTPRVCVARGGRGGKGNAAFRTPRHQTPRLAEKGEPGEERWLALELKLVADVGIIGVPNAGKSTLISRISAAHPVIADYPFTTKEPHLGVVDLHHSQMVFVDVPGLVAGAHQGTGMGIEFLRHVERTRLLVHLLDGAAADPLAEMNMIENELARYSPDLAAKPRLIVLNKLDLPQARAQRTMLAETLARTEQPFQAISAAAGTHLDTFIHTVYRMLEALPPVPEQGPLDLPAIVPQDANDTFAITRPAPGLWHIASPGLERIVRMTNWDYLESAMRFQHILSAWGIVDVLQQQGIEEGDTVLIADQALIWGYDNVG